MKAVLYHEPGGPEVLEYTDVADPSPGRLDVVVRVGATAINRLDVVQRHGWFQIPGFAFPHIAGMDIAGEVVEVGRDVQGLRIGDRVVVDPSLAEVGEGSLLAGRGDLYGELGVLGANADGGYAQYCLVPASHCHRLPGNMSFEHAATFPTCWLTAWHALFDVGELRAGEVVMIHAAGSGVSTAAIQLAKWRGATVFATAGTDAKCDKALALGADLALNNRTDDIAAWARDATDGRGVDMVFDHVGAALWAPSLFSLGVRGRLVSAGNTSGDEVSIPSLGHLFHMGLRILGSDPYRHHEFAAAWRVFCDGNFTAPIDSIFALADAGAAQEKLMSSDFFGKILLRP